MKAFSVLCGMSVAFLRLRHGAWAKMTRSRPSPRNSRPSITRSKNGKVVGYSTAIVEELLKRAKLPYEVNSYPWSRSYKMAQTLPNVLIFTLARTPERENEFQWIGAPAVRRLYLYKLAARKDINVAEGRWTSRTCRVSINRDDAAEKLLLEKGFVLDKNLDLATTELASLEQVVGGSASISSPATTINITFLAQKAGVERGKLERSVALIDQGEYFVAASRNTPPDTVKHLRAVYAEMEKSWRHQEHAAWIRVGIKGRGKAGCKSTGSNAIAGMG